MTKREYLMNIYVDAPRVDYLETMADEVWITKVLAEMAKYRKDDLGALQFNEVYPHLHYISWEHLKNSI